MGAAQPVTGVGDGRLGKSVYELERESEMFTLTSPSA